MKTTELINSLAADRRKDPPPGRALWRLLIAPVILAALLLLGTAGLRPDLGVVAATPRFLFKFLVTLSLAVAACGTLLRLARPEGRAGGWAVGLFVALGLLLAGVLLELFLTPSETWGARLRGTNATWCLRMIPMLSALPLLACFVALRRAAPGNAWRAGAAAGLFAAAIGAALYALHCTDDSPLFVAVWYGLSATFISAVGAALGARFLSW